MVKRILGLLKCAVLGHEPLVLISCDKTDALFHIGAGSVSLAKVRLCRRCSAVHWVPGDSVREKTLSGVEAMDAAIAAKAQDAVEEIARRMADKLGGNGSESPDDGPESRGRFDA